MIPLRSVFTFLSIFFFDTKICRYAFYLIVLSPTASYLAKIHQGGYKNVVSYPIKQISVMQGVSLIPTSRSERIIYF